MNMKPTLLILLITPLLFFSNISKAGDKHLQSHSSIIQTVENFLNSHSDIKKYPKKNIKIGHIDSRLQLVKCDEDLSTYFAPGARQTGKTTVGVRCSAPKPWALYVPASVEVYEKVYQTTANLPKGHVIGETDIDLVEKNLSKLNRGYFTDKSNLIGQQTRRSLLSGVVLTPSKVKPALLVKRGEVVSVEAKSRLYTIKMSGTALMDGAKGQKIRVKNLSSKRIIEGTVTEYGVVTVLN